MGIEKTFRTFWRHGSQLTAHSGKEHYPSYGSQQQSFRCQRNIRKAEHEIRPISVTPILAKVLESLVLKWVDICVKPQIDDRQFGGMAGTCTTNVLVEKLHTWYEATGVTGNRIIHARLCVFYLYVQSN